MKNIIYLLPILYVINLVGCSKYNSQQTQNSIEPKTHTTKLQFKNSKWAGAVVYEGGAYQNNDSASENAIKTSLFRISVCIDKSGIPHTGHINVPFQNLGVPPYGNPNLIVNYEALGKMISNDINAFSYKTDGPDIFKVIFEQEKKYGIILKKYSSGKNQYYLSLVTQTYMYDDSINHKAYDCEGQSDTIVIKTYPF